MNNIQGVVDTMSFEQVSEFCTVCNQYHVCIHPFNRECGVLHSKIEDAAEKDVKENEEENERNIDVDMFEMKKRIQSNLLKARQEMVDRNELTQFAMISVVDALFYLMEVNDANLIAYAMNTDDSGDGTWVE